MVRQAMAELYERGKEAVKYTLRNERQWLAWYRSSIFRGSGRWLAGITDHLYGKFEFIDNELYELALRIRLLSGPDLQWDMCALCLGIPFHGEKALHHLNCRAGQDYWRRRHEEVCDLVAGFVKKMGLRPLLEYQLPPIQQAVSGTPTAAAIPQEGVSTEEGLGHTGVVEGPVQEPATEPVQTKHRADVFYYRTTGTLQSVLIDVTVANPSAPSYASAAPEEKDDATAIARETEKRRRYDQFKNVHEIVPFVVEATGRLGPTAIEWMKEISKKQKYKRSSFREQIGVKVIQACMQQINRLTKQAAI